MKILAAFKPSSEEGSAVLESAIEEAERREAELLIVRHVMVERERLTESGLTGAPSARTPWGQEVDKLREEFEALRQQVELRGVRCEAMLLTEGEDPADEILAVAESTNVDLIVIGVRRRSPVGKAVLGSESQQILLNANCAVLAVKAKAEDG